MTETTQPKERTNFSAMIRQMLHEGKSFEEIEETLGVSRQLIHNVKYYAIHKAKRPGVRMSAKTGKLVRKYTRKNKPEQPEAPVETTIDTAPATPILSDEETKYQQEVRRSRPGRDIVPDTLQTQAALGYTTVSQVYVTGLENQCQNLKDKNRALTAQVKTLAAENVALRKEVQTLPKVIEVKVPQPFSHYTFWQRLRIVFLGRA